MGGKPGGGREFEFVLTPRYPSFSFHVLRGFLRPNTFPVTDIRIPEGSVTESINSVRYLPTCQENGTHDTFAVSRRQRSLVLETPEGL